MSAYTLKQTVMFLQTHIWTSQSSKKDMFYTTNLASFWYPQYTITWEAYFWRNRILWCHQDLALVTCFAFWPPLTKPDFPTTEAQQATTELHREWLVFLRSQLPLQGSCWADRRFSNSLLYVLTFAWKLTCSSICVFCLFLIPPLPPSWFNPSLFKKHFSLSWIPRMFWMRLSLRYCNNYL